MTLARESASRGLIHPPFTVRSPVLGEFFERRLLTCATPFNRFRLPSIAAYASEIPVEITVAVIVRGLCGRTIRARAVSIW